MKNNHYILLPLLFIFGCQKSDSISEKVTIVTSIFPVYDFIQEVGDDHIHVTYLVPSSANPHTYEITPSQVSIVKQANCFIGIQREFDGWIERFLSDQAWIVYLSESEASLHHESEISHSSDFDDPHIWLSVRHAKDIVAQISGLLSKITPDETQYYQMKAQQYVERLDSLDQQIAYRFNKIEHRKFIQWHPAWDRFAKDYHLIISGTAERGHGQDVSVRTFKQLIENARQEDVRIVVMGRYDQSNAAQSLTKEIGGKLLRLDTMGSPEAPTRNSYIKLMDDNARLLAKALEAL